MKQKKGFNLRPLGTEFILLPEDPELIDYHKAIAMNESSAYLWQALEGRDFDVKEMAELLLQRYDVPEERAEKDSAVLLDIWIQNGIVEK